MPVAARSPRNCEAPPPALRRRHRRAVLCIGDPAPLSSADMLDIRQRQQDGALIVELDGEAGSAEAWEVAEVVSRLIESRPAHIIFDLSRLSFISSLALAELIRLSNDLARFNTRVALAGLQPRIREVLHVLRMEQYYEIYSTLSEALSAAQKG